MVFRLKNEKTLLEARPTAHACKIREICGFHWKSTDSDEDFLKSADSDEDFIRNQWIPLKSVDFN